MARRFRSLVEESTSILGPEHADTLTVRNNLALSTGKAGDHFEAARLFRALLDDHVRLFGADHPATGLCRARLSEFGT